MRDDAVTLATWKNTLILRAEGRLELRHMEAEAEAFRDLSARYPSGFGLVGLIGSKLPLSDAPTRQKASQNFETYAKNFVAVAIAIEATGLWAATLRAAVTGVLMAVRTRFPVTVVPTARDALHWYGPRAGHHEAADLDALNDALKESRVGVTPAA
jgi:hypothetical protein